MASRAQRPDVVEAPSACRQLAARVIDQALKDAVRPDQRIDSRSARIFLSGTWMLHYWCGVAGLDTGRVIRAAKALMAVGGPPGAPRRRDGAANRHSPAEPGRLNTNGVVPLRHAARRPHERGAGAGQES